MGCVSHTANRSRQWSFPLPSALGDHNWYWVQFGTPQYSTHAHIPGSSPAAAAKMIKTGTHHVQVTAGANSFAHTVPGDLAAACSYLTLGSRGHRGRVKLLPEACSEGSIRCKRGKGRMCVNLMFYIFTVRMDKMHQRTHKITVLIDGHSSHGQGPKQPSSNCTWVWQEAEQDTPAGPWPPVVIPGSFKNVNFKEMG